MGTVPVLKPRQVVALLNKLEFAEVRQRGSHRQFRHVDGRGTTVPFHQGRDISPTLLRQIAKDIHISIEDLLAGRATPQPPPTSRRPSATYEDLLAVPDHLVAEILDGDLYTSPRPALRHADASSGLGGALRGPFDRGRGGPGGWRILDELELHLGRDVIVPDLAGWRRERLPHIPDEAHIAIAPDWVCEVLSPSTAALDRVKKLAIYARESVSHAWLVDPIAQTLEVYRLDDGRWTLVGTWAGTDSIRAEPFHALDLDLTLLWDDPAP